MKFMGATVKPVHVAMIAIGTPLTLGGYAYLTFDDGAAIGEPCGRKNECQGIQSLGLVKCVEVSDPIAPVLKKKYCTKRCANDDECPAGWRCATTAGLAHGSACMRPEK